MSCPLWKWKLNKYDTEHLLVQATLFDCLGFEYSQSPGEHQYSNGSLSPPKEPSGIMRQIQMIP